jgi:hypothetical protein
MGKRSVAQVEGLGKSVGRGKQKQGNLLRIPLAGNRSAYAQVSISPLIIFFDATFAEQPPLADIPSLPVAFRIWVMKHAVASGLWPVIGHQPLTPENSVEPYFWKQDRISGQLSLHHSSFASSNWERRATLAECEGLERAAVWDPEHVIDRLEDHFSHRPNKWMDSLKIDPTRIPKASTATDC